MQKKSFQNRRFDWSCCVRSKWFCCTY